MRVAELRTRLTLQRKVATSDQIGGRTVTWENVAVVWGNVKPVSAGERIRADRIDPQITHTVHIRFRDGVTEDMRFRMPGGRYLTINGKSVDVEGKATYLVLTCREGEPA
jgi:SPP1 family predicted phage head-tail adaptor